MANVFPPDKDVHETFDLKVHYSETVLETRLSYMADFYFPLTLLGFQIWPPAGRRGNSEESKCCYERLELGKKGQKTYAWPTQTSPLYSAVGYGCQGMISLSSCTSHTIFITK
jgi:hypothetical protein